MTVRGGRVGYSRHCRVSPTRDLQTLDIMQDGCCVGIAVTADDLLQADHRLRECGSRPVQPTWD